MSDAIFANLIILFRKVKKVSIQSQIGLAHLISKKAKFQYKNFEIKQFVKSRLYFFEPSLPIFRNNSNMI